MQAHLTILDEIGLRLTNITTANGYTHEFGSAIKRASLIPFKNGDLPAVNYWPVSDELISKEYNTMHRLLHVSVEAYAITRDNPFTDVALELSSDIGTGLFRTNIAPMVSDAISPSLGGLVSSLLVDTVTPVLGEGQSPWCGVLLDLGINYKTNLGDMVTILT